MWKISEVCEIVGVTRRTLQEYNKIGLLKPTAKTESGYWLYDEHAIHILEMIQIFIEVGYTRKQIKEFLESPDSGLQAEYNRIISMLEENRKKLDAMLDIIKSMKTAIQLPIRTYTAFSNVTLQCSSYSKSFSALLRESILKNVENSQEVRSRISLYTPFFLQFCAIGFSNSQTTSQETLYQLVLDCYNTLFSQVLPNLDDIPTIERSALQNLTSLEKVDFFKDFSLSILSIDTIQSFLEDKCSGSVNNIIDAINSFHIN